jgi:hypothetical protein
MAFFLQEALIENHNPLKNGMFTGIMQVISIFQENSGNNRNYNTPGDIKLCR